MKIRIIAAIAVLTCTTAASAYPLYITNSTKKTMYVSLAKQCAAVSPKHSQILLTEDRLYVYCGMTIDKCKVEAFTSESCKGSRAVKFSYDATKGTFNAIAPVAPYSVVVTNLGHITITQ